MFKYDGPYTTYVNLNQVTSLMEVSVSGAPVTIGARVGLTRCIELFRQVATGPKSVPGYQHLEEIADHWQVVANLAVRNVRIESTFLF